MPAKRSRLSIVASVLRALEDSSMPASRICERANLPYDKLSKILEKLEEEGLVSCEKRGRARVYRITEKGARELKKLEEAYMILKRLGLDA